MAKFITIAGKKQVGKDTSAQFIGEILDSCIREGISKRCVEEDLHGPTGMEPSVHIAHFADSLKDACATIFGVSRHDMETEAGKKKLTDVAWPDDRLHIFDDGRFRNDGNNSTCKVWIPYTHSGPLSWLHSKIHQGSEGPKYMTVRELLQFVGTELFRNQIDPDIWVKSVFRGNYKDNDIVIVADCRFPNEADFARRNGLLIKVERNNGLASDSHISETVLDDYPHFDYIVDNNGSLPDLKKNLHGILQLARFIV